MAGGIETAKQSPTTDVRIAAICVHLAYDIPTTQTQYNGGTKTSTRSLTINIRIPAISLLACDIPTPQYNYESYLEVHGTVCYWLSRALIYLHLFLLLCSLLVMCVCATNVLLWFPQARLERE